MKLLRIYKKNNSYTIEALKSIKVWKFKLGRKKISFKHNRTTNSWYYANNQLKVRNNDLKVLQRWIENHHRFLEK